MPALSKKIKELKKYNEERKAEAKGRIVDVTRFVFSSFLFSMEFSSAAGFTLMNDIDPPSESEFYKAEKNVVKTLLDLAHDEVNKNLQELQEGSIIAIDGSWGTRRNSRTFILDAIDVSTQKIVSFILEDKGDDLHPYKGASNMMEASAFRKMARILKDSGKIRAIVKDGDTKLMNIAKEIAWNVTFIQDPQHLKKNFGVLFTKYNKLAGGKLKGLKEKIINHINYVLYSEKTPDEKRTMFMNIIQHFTGNHVNCAHDAVKGTRCKIIKDSKIINLLKQLIQEVAKSFGDFDPKLTTNYNENFHSVKARYLTKVLHLGYSWKGRIAAAILQYNDKYNWISKAYNALHLPPLSATCALKFLKLIHHSLQRMKANKAKRSTKEAKEKRREEQIRTIKLETTKNPEAHI